MSCRTHAAHVHVRWGKGSKLPSPSNRHARSARILSHTHPRAHLTCTSTTVPCSNALSATLDVAAHSMAAAHAAAWRASLDAEVLPYHVVDSTTQPKRVAMLKTWLPGTLRVVGMKGTSSAAAPEMGEAWCFLSAASSWLSGRGAVIEVARRRGGLR